MKPPRSVEILAPLLAGLLTAIGMQMVEGWWLNSGRGVTHVGGAFFLLAIVCATWSSMGAWVVRLVPLWLGAQIGLIGFLFWMGPGNIWPITIVIGGIVSGLAMLAGGGVAQLTAHRFGGRA